MNRHDVSNISLSKKQQSTPRREHEGFVSGIPPYLRGSSSTMFIYKSWGNEKIATERQHAIDTNNFETELAYALSLEFKSIKEKLKKNSNTNELKAQLYFTSHKQINHFTEIAKMRVTRMLWSKMIKSLDSKKNITLTLYYKTASNSSLTDDSNIITKTSIKAISAILGGVEILNTCIDEHKLLIDSQSFFKKETQITRTIDPWGGSFYLEKLTEEISIKTWKIIQEIENKKNS